MTARDLTKERAALAEYIAERPSAQDAREWLDALGMAKIEVTEWPLEIESGSGYEFLHHPLLRGGFLDDAYECFENQRLAEDVMTTGTFPAFFRLLRNDAPCLHGCHQQAVENTYPPRYTNTPPSSTVTTTPLT